MTLAPLCSVMRTMRPQSVRNSHTFVSAMKTTNGKCWTRTREDTRTTSLRAIRIRCRNQQPSLAAQLVTMRRRRWQRCLYWHSWGSPDSIFCLCICVPSAQNFRILLALLVVSLPFCASPSTLSLSLSLSSPLCLPHCCTPPFIHGLRFRLMRCEFIAKCNTRCLLSFPLSLSLFLTSLGLSAVKQRRQRRTRQTRSKAFC